MSEYHIIIRQGGRAFRQITESVNLKSGHCGLTPEFYMLVMEVSTCMKMCPVKEI